MRIGAEGGNAEGDLERGEGEQEGGGHTQAVRPV